MAYINELTEERLQEYIRQREFQMYLQPQYSVTGNTIVGAEALARWKHHGAFVSPAEFIPVLEQKGLIAQLDSYIWECAFELQAQKQQEGIALVPISLNVSREDFSEIDVYQTLTDLSRRYDVSPAYIHIEITESAFVNDKEAIYETVGELKAYGFMILIDDFGSGYSALNTLKDIEADIVKLDMKFFDLTEKNDEKGRNIICSVIQMTQLIGLGIIAEGVENTDQLDILKEAGCDIIQGYFFYRPMSVEKFDTLMRGIHKSCPRKKGDAATFGRECFEESRKLLDKGEYDNALTLAKRAAEQISPNSDARLYCDLENLMGVIYGAMGNELLAVEHYLAGLSVATKNDLSVVCGKLYNNIGSEYQSLNDHEHAIKYFELSANELSRENNIGQENYELRAFITNMNLCVEYYALEEYERAEEYLNRAGVYMDHPGIENNRFHYLTLQSNLFMKTGRQEEARKNFPALLELTLNAEDRSDFWGDMEMLGNLALELREFTAMKRILDNMDRQLKLFAEGQIGLDIQVKIQEMRLAYCNGIGDSKELRKAELAYIELCKKQYLEGKRTRAAAIDYKIQLNSQYEENVLYRKQIDIDQLTGVGNRYKLEKDYKMLKRICDERGGKIGIGIIDLDYFKEVNDTYGHLQGDYYLKVVSQVIKKIIASTGGIYRYGGDEFVVLLVDVDTPAVEQIARQIQENTESQQLCNQASDKKVLTVSQGYIVLDQIENVDIWQILPYADRQLYFVKNNGKHGYRITDEMNG